MHPCFSLSRLLATSGLCPSFLKDNLSICPLLGASITGSLNFLPLPLTATHIACILLILYYITGYVIVRQKRVKLGKPMFLWPILIIISIVLYHNHTLNVGILGGDTEGGRAAFLIYLVVLAYFCGINITWPLRLCLLSKSSALHHGRSYRHLQTQYPFFLSTYFPSLAPLLYNVTGNVNVEAYLDTQTGTNLGTGGAIGRLGAFGTLGNVSASVLYFALPLSNWDMAGSPERWWGDWSFDRLRRFSRLPAVFGVTNVLLVSPL